MAFSFKNLIILSILFLGMNACAVQETNEQNESLTIQEKNERAIEQESSFSKAFKKNKTPNKKSPFQAGDHIHIVVVGEDSLSGVYQISETGEVTMPLIGSFFVSGMQITDIQARVKERLQDGYIKEPFVQVMQVKGHK